MSPLSECPCEIAFSALCNVIAGSISPAEQGISKNGEEQEACVTFRRRGLVRGCQAAQAHDWNTAVYKAATRASRDPRYDEISILELDELDVEVWICKAKFPSAYVTPEQLEGLEGTEITNINHTKRAFFLPSVAAELELISDFALLNALYVKAGLMGKVKDVSILRVRWEHYILPHGAKTSTRMRQFSPNSNLELGEAAQIVKHSVEFLCRTQQPDGRFEYIISPRPKTTHQEDSATVTRQLLCAYALSTALQDNGRSNPSMEAALCKTYQYLQDRLLLTKRGLVVRGVGGRESLGAVAFALLFVFRAHDAILPANQRTHLISSLTGTLLRCQDSTGFFSSEINITDSSGRQDFAPGQAIMALALTDYVTHKDAIKRAFEHYSKVDLQTASIFYIVWQSKAWLTVWEQSHSEHHLNLANRLLDTLAGFQIVSVYSPDNEGLIGGFEITRGTGTANFTTSLFAEALALGAIAARRQNDDARYQRFMQATIAAFKFMSQLQVGAECAIYYEQDISVIGGIRMSPSSLNLRCDSTGHAVTFFRTVSHLFA